MTELLSFGGGVNSTAMAILMVNEGWRGPIVFSDTGAEWPETYCYMDMFEREWLKPRGLEITRLDGEWRTEKRARTGTILDYCESYDMLPLAGIRWCTRLYKIEPIATWASAHDIETQYIGIAADEAHRQKGRPCPLIDRGITRRGCIDIIQAEGLDVPQKSGCYICPFQRDSQWRTLWQRYPELFERAAKLEEGASARTGRYITLDPSGKVTLRDRQYRYEHQLGLFDDAEMDGFLAYQPCHCGL